jgi:hypothetical protein
MFRGGRVDARGTGIASGLGYAKGGSVNTPKRGLVDGPGGYSGATLGWNLLKAGARPAMKYGKKGLDWLLEPKGGFPMKIRGGAGGTMDKYIKQTMPPRSWGEFGKELGTSRLGQYLSQSPTLNLLGWGAKKSPGLAKKATSPEGLAALYFGGPYAKDLWDEYSPWADEEIVTDSGAIPKAIMENEAKEKALTADQVKLMEMENLYKNLRANTKKAAEGEGEESLDIDKEKFAKLLGSDKARGEDISNMLLSFAGKALKPEATVKGAFGEFFEEESKRPSSKTKIDQAAAQLAINKYIKGEMTKKEAETYLKRLELQYSLQSEGKKQSIGEFYLASKSPNFTGKVKDAIIAGYGQEGIVPEFEVTTSKKMEEDFEFGDKDVGVIFIETDTKKAYTFNSQGKIVPVLSG